MKLRNLTKKFERGNYTSSNFWQIIPNAFDKVSIVPTIVTIRSGVVPSLILIRAPL